MTDETVLDDKIHARSPTSSASNGVDDNDETAMTVDSPSKTETAESHEMASAEIAPRSLSQSSSTHAQDESHTVPATKSPSSHASSSSNASAPNDLSDHHHLHHRQASSPSTPDTSPDTSPDNSDATNRNQFVAFHGLSQANLLADHHANNTSSSYSEPQHKITDSKELSHMTSREHSPDKPTVGSEEWLRVRRNNHKVVERRRRENINTGINELAKIVPQCDKNKGKILERAAQYIRVLKDQESASVEKYTLEKLVMEQTIADLGSQNDKLRAELEKSWKELATLRKELESRSNPASEPRSL